MCNVVFTDILGKNHPFLTINTNVKVCSQCAISRTFLGSKRWFVSKILEMHVQFPTWIPHPIPVSILPIHKCYCFSIILVWKFSKKANLPWVSGYLGRICAYMTIAFTFRKWEPYSYSNKTRQEFLERAEARFKFIRNLSSKRQRSTTCCVALADIRGSQSSGTPAYSKFSSKSVFLPPCCFWNI